MIVPNYVENLAMPDNELLAWIRQDQRTHVVLRQLAEARRSANALRADHWTFAVELPSLLAAGASTTQIRVLLSSGLIEHAVETTPSSAVDRTFESRKALTFTTDSCFIITQAGTKFLSRLNHPALQTPSRLSAPKWDSLVRQLTWCGLLVKEFRVPARSQEAILAAFEEEGWPCRIDDPLSRLAHSDPEQRLHEAVRGLNRNQVHRLLHFGRDGKGQGIIWNPRSST